MMNETQYSPETKLELLSIELRRQHKYHHNSFRSAILFSLVLLVFFALYTSLILYKIREVATPTTIALLIAGELRDEAYTRRSPLLSEDYRLLARETAHAMASALPLFSGPAASDKIRSFLDEKNLSGAERYAEKVLHTDLYTQTLHQILRSPAEKDYSRREQLRHTEQILSALAQEKGSASGSSWEKTHPLFCFTPGHTADQLSRIRQQKKPEALHAKDLAFRDFILCSLYFGEHKRYLDSKYSLIFDLALPVMQELGYSVPDEKRSVSQNRTKNNPHRKKAPARK